MAIVGIVVAVALYIGVGENLFGINTGLISLAVNTAVLVGGSLVRPGRHRDPVALRNPPAGDTAAEGRPEVVSM